MWRSPRCEAFRNFPRISRITEITETTETTEVLIQSPSLLSLLVHVVSCVMASEAITVPEFVLKYGDSKVKLDRTIGRCKTAKSNLFAGLFSFR